MQYLAEGETVTATYTITVADDSGALNAEKTQDVTVVITGTNDQPEITTVDVAGEVVEDASTVADNPNTETIEEGAYLADSGSLTFTDADTTDLSNVTVALSADPVASTGASVSTELAAALAEAVV